MHLERSLVCRILKVKWLLAFLHQPGFCHGAKSWVIERASDVQEGMVLVLHDLQHAFAENLCDKAGVLVAWYT
jgi:hypothetical protein